jgi:chemotaxis protein methyltransferase CheR
MHETALKQAREGIFPLALMREYTSNYIEAGGKREFSEYYTARYDHACLQPALRRNVVFYRHNLATDSPFNTFHVVMCRNVMIYFNAALQGRAHDLIYRSLLRLGFLGLGSNETVKFTAYAANYQALDPQQRIFRKVG